jgi:hypothetical protein
MSTQLVQIKPAPPLHQSTISVLACELAYKAIFIDGLKPPPSGPSDRGVEVHDVAARYTNHCVKKKVPADWQAFDLIAKSVGAEAYAILEGVRDHYTVDFEHVAGTEIDFYLDKNFQPCDRAIAAYSGRMDIGLLDGADGGVDDWKSHMRPFDAPDPQSDLYSLAWFQLNPQLERVTFRFRFVRYAHCERTAEYERADLPRLMAAMEHHRAKQLSIHANPASVEAIPSKQCLYCPLLNNGCPIPEQVNPYASPPLDERLRLAVYFSYANSANNAKLTEFVDAAGAPVRYVDGKGDAYEFGSKATESQEFPLLPVMEKLADWKHAAPDDVAWFDKLRVSATKLKSYLKAKKRVTLDLAIRDVSVPVTRIKTGLHCPVDENDIDKEYGGE